LTQAERSLVQNYESKRGLAGGVESEIRGLIPKTAPTADDIARITANVPVEKYADPRYALEAHDPRSVAAREQFVQKATIPIAEYQRRIAAGGQPVSSAVIPSMTPEGTLTGGYRPQPAGTTITTPETAARQANLPGQHALERQKLVQDYRDLQQAARERPMLRTLCKPVESHALKQCGGPNKEKTAIHARRIPQSFLVKHQ
jgi:hypothetical protein